MISLFNKQRSAFRWVLCSLIIALFYTGCKNEELIRPGDSIDVAYKKALSLYRAEDYRDAAKAFETVISSARGTDYAKSSYFFMAESYFNSSQYLLAADAYNRLVSLYPQSERAKEARYKEALSYYKLSPRYKIDQQHTRKSIEKFRLYLSRYPDSEKADQAGKYLTEMRSKLARKHYEAADLYIRLEQYRAATTYYELTVNKYPETKWAEKALVKEISTYVTYANNSVRSKQRERYKKAVEAYEKYLQLFPDGPNRQQAEANVDDARAALADLEPRAPQNQTTSADQ